MKYFLKRAGLLLLTMALASLVTFFAFQLISGDPAEVLLGTGATPARVAALREELGLNAPLIVRYFRWLGGFFTGDLGVSYSYKQPVWELLAPKVGVTLCLSALSFVLIAGVSIPLGVLTAQIGNRGLLALRAGFNQLCMAIPPFALGIVISWLCGIVLRQFTPGSFPGLTENFPAALRYLFFAAVCIAVPRVAMTVRMLRSTVTAELNKDYVRTARSRGRTESGVLFGHVLKNALTAVITFLGQTMAEIVGAGIVVEQVFALPGLGRMLVASISNRDYPVVQATVMLLAFWVALTGTAADLINRAVDPRLRLGGEQT